jgi:hypothetical protein
VGFCLKIAGLVGPYIAKLQKSYKGQIMTFAAFLYGLSVPERAINPIPEFIINGRVVLSYEQKKSPSVITQRLPIQTGSIALYSATVGMTAINIFNYRLSRV